MEASGTLALGLWPGSSPQLPTPPLLPPTHLHHKKMTFPSAPVKTSDEQDKAAKIKSLVALVRYIDSY